ncbi:MAG: heavy metal translocating P-type ATPase, partial [Selenomonadaceae bacterium]|nr:heavy metal translocating P-type ATPase [Selenomonadaceae bacterium]
MNPKQKKNLARIIIAAALLIALNFVEISGVTRFIFYLVPYLIVGYDILLKALHGLKNLRALDESLLMTIATVGAFALAIHDDGDYNEAIAVMLFYQIGEWFQSYAVGRSRKNISELMDIRPDFANVETAG